MSDAIRILGMQLRAHVGAAAGEREKPQPIDADLELEVDCGPAAKSDDLADAVDYAAVFGTCARVVSGRSFALLEALAAACLEALFLDRRIKSATIRVRKPGLLGGATPEVQLTRANRGKAALPRAEKHRSNARKH
jgi:dihydroneopterin aldolase